MSKPLIIAHRGASGYAPENTQAAFQMALDMGADGIELDVQLSRDRYPIVCHDEKVDRTTSGMGYIKDLTLKEIKKLDAGSWYHQEFNKERVLTLEEVLEMLKGKDILLNIELKNGIVPYEHLEEKVVRLIRSYGLQDKAIISSFNHYSLLKIKKLDRTLKTGVLYMAGLVEPWEYAKKLKADAIHPLYFNIRRDLVKQCMLHHMDIHTFTVNEMTELALIAKMGVTGIITDYPDRGRKIVGDKKVLG